MRLLALSLAAMAALVPPSFAQVIAIRAGRVLDPATGSASLNEIILVQRGRIGAIGPNVTIPAGATVYDLSNATLIPGLIDAHVHLALGGPVRSNALADLRAGFTTVIDLGARTQRLLGIRDSINAGLIPGPRVFAAGIWVGRKNGVCEFGGIGIAGGADAFRRRVRENIAAGADFIKVCVTGWPAEAYAHPDAYELPDSVLKAVVDAAHAGKRRVLAHDISRGGVRVGVRLVFGTDGGVLPHGQNAREFVAMYQAGVPLADLLRSATVNAARALGLDSLGQIGPGMVADIVALAEDPRGDVTAYQKVRFVMSRGQVVVSPR